MIQPPPSLPHSPFNVQYAGPTKEQYLEKLETKLKTVSGKAASEGFSFRKGTADALADVRISTIEIEHRVNCEEVASSPFVESLVRGERNSMDEKNLAFDYCDSGPLLEHQHRHGGGENKPRNYDDPKYVDNVSSDDDSESESEVGSDEDAPREKDTCCERCSIQ